MTYYTCVQNRAEKSDLKFGAQFTLDHTKNAFFKFRKNDPGGLYLKKTFSFKDHNVGFRLILGWGNNCLQPLMITNEVELFKHKSGC